MSAQTLTSPRDAGEHLGCLFSQHEVCCLEVREEKAFGDERWMNLGRVLLDRGDGSNDALRAAVRRGGFEWELPSLQDACTELGGLLGVADPANSSKIRRALDAVAAITFRAGLQYPQFDPAALESMPFKRSTTIVADTSGAVQGGLDFVAQHLHPAARVKVPAIVQMEIVNFAERFFSNRRTARPRASDLLIDHLISQGGQRVLLRLELHADTEIERTFLLGDPLRSAFQPDTEQEVSGLNLAVALRSYSDRLIVESARQHQAQANLGHPVQLLTSDQGLARMAMAEGLTPLFFNSVTGAHAFGKRLSGQVFSPFAGTAASRSLGAVLWEVASAFGSARLRDEDGEHRLTVTAMGETLTWSPYQSHSDLLWCDATHVPGWSISADPVQILAPEIVDRALPLVPADSSQEGRTSKLVRRNRRMQSHEARTAPAIPLQRLSVSRLFDLIDALDNEQVLAPERVLQVAQVRSRESVKEYSRFLIAAGLAAVDGGSWASTEVTRRLAVALRAEDTPAMVDALARAPSFALFAERLGALPVGESWNPKEFGRAAHTYRTLGEVCRMCAPIAGDGLFPTPSDPNADIFAPIAVERFRELDKGDGLVATGAWLEALIRRDGVHPEIAREKLNEASALHLLKRSTEGSTTEVRFDNHVIQVLRVRAGKPEIEDVHLYRGDYLIPGKSSTSLRIEALQE